MKVIYEEMQGDKMAAYSEGKYFTFFVVTKKGSFVLYERN